MEGLIRHSSPMLMLNIFDGNLKIENTVSDSISRAGSRDFGKDIRILPAHLKKVRILLFQCRVQPISTHQHHQRGE